ncbi:hypothetical protein C8A00DRAFT_44407 [Chaetomidium leptoderma]|uniref:non-specific serine/threonine protein kinase n=1 Tax=Chaetomidium leptoderma TaxID=669021 RepID=A0AAN6VK08_9PEZI|nr:hypothetical protein C8A00DRAFT_44407 [Chaetomidium leptoderma]
MKPIIAIPATLLLVYRAHSKKSLTPGGILAAALTAVAHAVHPWNLPFVLLIVFFLAGTRATHVKENVKASLTLKAGGTSGGEGPRNHVQVLANSLTASILSLLHAYQLRSREQSLVASSPNDGAAGSSLCFAWGGDLLVIGIIANYACVAADTFSSELGILAKGQPRLITSLTLRKVARGTNGGVTLTGLAAGLLGSVIVVTAAMLFLPFCTDETSGKLGGGLPWSNEQRRTLILGLTVWGFLGSVVDSILGGLFQTSVKDTRSGKIVEGEGGVRVLVSAGTDSHHPQLGADVKAALLHGEGESAVEDTHPTSAETEGHNARPDKYDARNKHRRSSFGDEKPSRTIENGWDLLDNNDVNFLMAFGMSVGAMAVASWYWQVPLSSHPHDDPHHHHHHPPPNPGSSIDAAIMSSESASATAPNAQNAPHREKARTEQRIGAYNIVKTLGEGSFGKVKLAVHRSTGQQVALKIISRKNLISRDMQGRVEREIEYLQLLRHPHIIKLFTVIKTPTEIIMVLEYAGGELFDYIVAHGKMQEDEARRFFQQMLCAVEYCHRHKIVHRDLKPENLLLDDSLNVKIADFGLSNIMTDGNFLKTSCGSPNYAAPEVIGGKLYAGPEVDVWSCGVILYVLLVGRLPFDHEHIPTLFAKIARGSYMVPTWMTPGAANLIKKMLVVNPVHRATIEDIRQDPWFLKDLPAYLHPPVEEFLNTGVDPNKAIKVSDIAPNAPPQEQEKLHNEVTDKISKTMGYGKRDVEEALEADEPSAIKDAYMIVRENKMMQLGGGLGAEDATPSPLLDPNMSSARSVTSTSTTGASARPPYVSKVGILPGSLTVYHRAYIERERANAEGIELREDPLTAPEASSRPQSQAEQEETVRRLKPHSRSFVPLDDASRPQGLTPVNPPKKTKPVRWQFGIRSRNAPWEALLCIYKALNKLGAGWMVDEDYETAHQDDDNGDYNGRHSRKQSSSSGADPTESYRLPADPWHINIRWATNKLQKQSVDSGLSEAGADSQVTREGRDIQAVAMRMEIQIYEMEPGVFLVDFKVDGYETPDGKLLEDKEVASPFPFLDMAARLIMQLADAD